jgi:4-diphosphocytidyl-2-C-methyl-D-erythritol kinase
MGGGLGGGSSNAAAVLLALPILSGRPIDFEQLLKLASQLGSDVPFFLLGGTAAAIGRGTELYPLADLKQDEILVVATGVHVATGPAYAALNRKLTFTGSSSSINGFQGFARALDGARSAAQVSALGRNDFESVVFREHPQLKKILRELSDSAAGARMTGSGSSIFAIYRSRADRERAQNELAGKRVFEGCRMMPARLVSRRAYQDLWLRQLRDHLTPGLTQRNELWPPRSRYEG